MDTFKHVCGFVLLAAMVWVLTWLKLTHVAPTVAFLVGLWAACWVIGRVPHTESGRARLRAWLVGCTIAVVTSWYAFGSLAPSMDERYEQLVSNEVAKRTQVVVENSNTGEHLSWQPFSTNLLKQLTGDHKTVMVDFTAEWCVNCKTLEYLVLNTPEIRSAVTRNGVVPLLADYTDTPPELTEMLSLLKAGGVPVLAIFPAGDPNNPIVFRSGYTKQTLIEALDKAGPSQSIAEIGTATLN
jgi:thiol:disulfide interchange protein